jgi:membrane protein DedA with SNARE-associated domain
MRLWLIFSVFALLLLTVILGPFVLFEATINGWVEKFVAPEVSKGAAAAAIAGILAADVFLPVPSSLVSTASGALLGFATGAVVSTAGMTVGCMLGYLCGNKFGPLVILRVVRNRDLEQVSAVFRRHAEWVLVIMRPIPVLAEASSVVAGMAGMPFWRFASISALANAGISAAYCAVGAYAVESGSFLLALAGSMAIPACAMILHRVPTRHLLTSWFGRSKT